MALGMIDSGTEREREALGVGVPVWVTTSGVWLWPSSFY